ncbi:MAG: hypothetical protein P1V97_29945 [Planctomycetota bacterium]|nr:hypothetical protein [Planctomycetota bacterium]
MKTFAQRAMILSLGFALVMPVAEAKLDSKEWSKLGKKARRAAKQGDGGTVAMLIPDIAADDSVRAVDLIGALSMLDDNDVYEAAQAALANMSDSKAVSHMCVKLSKGSGKWAFRVLLADAFGNRSDGESMQALNTATGDRRPEVLRSVIDAILQRRDKSSVSPLIDLLASYEKKKKTGLNVEKVREALTSLTGEDFSAAVDWKSWWDPRKSGFDVPERPTTGAKAKKVEGTMERKPKFFGSELKSRRIVFVIDVSGSMQMADPGVPGGNTPKRPTSGGKNAPKPDPVSKSRVRIERAKFQLELAVKALPKDCKFSIIAYHGGGGGVPTKGQKLLPQSDKMPWLSVFSKKLVPASSKSVKSKAVTFIRALKPMGVTWTFNAIRSAFEIIECDNVIVLSDGAPNDPPYGKSAGAAPNPGAPGGGMSTDDILKEVKGLNNRRKLRIDTFGFDPNAGRGGRRGGSVIGGMSNPYVDFLKKLAKQNGGKFTPIK